MITDGPFAGEDDPEAIEGPLDRAAFLNLAQRAIYGWTILTNGDIAGLTAGDMDYEECGANLGHIVSHAMTAASSSIEQAKEIDKALETLINLCVKALEQS